MGTMDSSAFKDKDRKDGSGKRDVFFNGPGDGKRHGHVVEQTDKTGARRYPYVRDVEGNVYADDSKRSGPPLRKEQPKRDGGRGAQRAERQDGPRDRDR